MKHIFVTTQLNYQFATLAKIVSLVTYSNLMEGKMLCSFRGK
jgi:hypothetical protein